MSAPSNTVTYKELLRFFMPLAMTIITIALTHNVVTSALTRLPSPEINISVYTVVIAFFQVIKSPIMISRHAFISLVGNKETFVLTRKYLWILGATIFIILFMLAFTPLGDWILRNFIGLKDSQISQAYKLMKILCFIPLVEIWRNENQALIISLKKLN